MYYEKLLFSTLRRYLVKVEFAWIYSHQQVDLVELEANQLHDTRLQYQIWFVNLSRQDSICFIYELFQNFSCGFSLCSPYLELIFLKHLQNMLQYQNGKNILLS